MAKVKFYQQGDVLMIAKTIPAGAKKIDARPLALGEATGHSHTISNTAVEYREHENKTYIIVPRGGADVKHQEHKAVHLKEGTYEIGTVKEFDPFEEVLRNVRD